MLQRDRREGLGTLVGQEIAQAAQRTGMMRVQLQRPVDHAGAFHMAALGDEDVERVVGELVGAEVGNAGHRGPAGAGERWAPV